MTDIRRADGAHALLRLGCVSALPLARLEIDDAATAQALIPHCASLDVGRGGSQTWRIVFWSAAAVCSIVAVVLYGIPFAADRLAPLVPMSVENRIGEAVDKQVRVMLGGKTCDGAAGRLAFTAMVDKIRRAGGIETPLDAAVLSSSVPNAFALPGGKVYLLDGLLQKARNADEVAGVIAHELGHVHHRDNLRKIIQEGGTSFLVGLLLGDVTGATAVIFAARSVLDASYSREAEQPRRRLRGRGHAQARPLGRADGRAPGAADRRRPEQVPHHHRQPSAVRGPPRRHDEGGPADDRRGDPLGAGVAGAQGHLQGVASGGRGAVLAPHARALLRCRPAGR